MINGWLAPHCHVGRFRHEGQAAELYVDDRDNSHDSIHGRGGLGAGVPFRNIEGRASLVWMSLAPTSAPVAARQPPMV
ncbi:hypothetical protein [Sorangium sp. So ce1335]|uniref:hypothetical protein n=1 Tax=Sorangium sp. So ce1335 TaxID=3133335 RepID=UPI003F5E09C3